VCANTANLLLVRGNGRRREMAVRTAMGATRARLVRQLLIENGILTIVGSLAGLLIADWSIHLLVSHLPVHMLPRQGMISIDSTVLLTILLLSALTALLFGTMPALQASRADVQEALQETLRSTGGRHIQWRRRFLASMEVAVAMVLLVGASLMARSFLQLVSI